MDHRRMTRSDRSGEAAHTTDTKRPQRQAKPPHEPGVRSAKADDDLSKAPAIVDPRREIETDL
jgi:hypothetical protein